MCSEIKRTKSDGWSFTSFDVKTLTFLPQEPNTYDCGVYLLNFMEKRCGKDMERDMVFYQPPIFSFKNLLYFY